MSRIARNSVNGWLNRNTCSGAEGAPVQCKRGLSWLVVGSNISAILCSVAHSLLRTYLLRGQNLEEKV